MNHFQNTLQRSILHFRVKLFFVILISNFSGLYADAPDWSVNAADYSSNLSLVSEFYLNEEVFDSDNIVGAFVGEECRGVSTVAAYGDGYVYLITIYSNTVGETVNFKAWIADEDAVVDVEESITYAPGVIGTLSSPEQFTAFQNFDFSPSLSGIPDQIVHMGDDFTTITLGDYLTVEDSDELLWTTSSASHFTINISEDIITLTPETDWIGSESIIFTVTELTENGYSDSDTAIYTQLRSDDPPVIVGLPDQVIGTNATFLSFDLDDYITEVDDDPLIYEYNYGDPVDTHDDPGWIVVPSDFEFSMSMVIRVKARGVYADGSSHYLTALDEDGGVRGIAQAVAFLDEWRYLLTIYSESEGDRMSFRFYDATNSLNIPIADTVTFVNNSVIGTASMPYDLVANFLDIDLDQNGEVSISRVEQSWSGSESIIFSITDDGTQNSYFSSDEAIYTVEGDYEPILYGIPDQSIGPDGTFSLINLDSYLETFDDDEILWSISGNVDLNVSIDGSIVTITHDSDYIGSETLVFTATDDNETGFSSSDTASYSVVAYDNIPLLFNVPDQTIAIGEVFDTLDLSAYLTEVDGHDVMWDYEFLDYPSTVPTPDWEAPLSGTYTMGVVSTVEALGIVAEGSDHILIAVDENYDILGLSNAVNVSNTWIYNMTLYSDENNIDYKFVFYDNSCQRILPVDIELEFVAGNVVGSASEPIELNAGRVFISVDGQGKVSFDILTDDWDLAETVRFTVTDAFTDENKSSYNDISIMIENDLPVLSISSWTTQEGGSFETFSLADYVSDNGTPFDSLLIDVSTGPNYTAEIVDDIMNVYPPSDPDWHGSELVSFEITDAHPYNVKTLEADMEFIINPVNDAPIIADKSNEVIDEDVPTTFAMELTDIDTGEVLTLSSISSVSELSVTTSSEDSTITVTPAADWYGESEVVVIVSDGELTDTTSFMLTVSPVNDAPRLAEVLDQIILEDDTLMVPLEVVNVDTGETLTAFVSSSSDRVSITANSDDLIIEAVPDKDWHGQTEIDVIVSDGEFAQAISFVLIVHPVNDAPVIEHVDSLFIDENSPLVVGIDFYDVDSEVLTVSSFSDRDEVTTVASVSSSSVEIFTSDFHGESEITVIVSDGELSDTTDFIVTIVPTNDAPIIAPVENISIEENSEITVHLELTDIDTGEVLTVVAYSDTVDVIVTANSADGLYDSTITISTTDDWHGFSLITVIVSDGELTDTTQFSVAVGPVNDAPIIIAINDQVLNEDSVGVFAFEVSDIDTGTVLTLSAFSDTSSVSVITDSEDYTVTVTPNQNWHGQAEITVIVSDNFLTDTTFFTITMTPVNDAPIIAEKSDQVIDEDIPETFPLELTDIDTGEVLMLSVSSAFSELDVTANSDDSTITVTPEADWYGESEVVVIVSDGELSDTTSFMVTIDPVNDAPRLAEIMHQNMAEDDTLVVPLEVVNVDTGETLTAFVSSTLDEVFITANSNDLTIEAIPEPDWHGLTEVDIIVSDGLLAQSVSFLLTVEPVNDAPIITTIENINIEENEQYVLELELTDIDTGEVLHVSAYSDTVDVVVVANAPEGLYDSTLTISTTTDWYGQSEVTVIVSDGGLADTTQFMVAVGPVNDPPSIVSIDDQSIHEDSVGVFSFEVSDIDTGTVLTLAAYTDTSSVSVSTNSDNYTVTATPDGNWHGQTVITVIISDQQLTESTSFTLTVMPGNDAPIISEISDVIFPEDSSYNVTFQLSDIDTGEVLIFSAFSDTGQVVVTYDSSGSTISIVPDPDWNGESLISAIVSDEELSDTTTFTVTITNTPDVPFAVLQGDMKSIQDQFILVDGSASYDIDNDDLTYYWTIIPMDSLFTFQGIIGDTVVTESAFLGFQTPVRLKEHDFCIKLWVENSNELVSNMDSLMLNVQNIEANDILPDMSNKTYKLGDVIPIQVQIPAWFVVDSIALSYANNYSGFITNDMVEQSSSDLERSSFLYEIPFYMSDIEGLAYYVYVSDANGSTIITDTTDIILSFNDGVVSSGIMHSEYVSGFPKGSWRMISVPSYLDSKSLEMLYKVLGFASDSKWMIYEWSNYEGDDESDIEIGWRQPNLLDPGKAYWLKQFVVDGGYFAAPSGETVELSGYDISVDPGWNMISSPYVFPVSVDIDRNIFSELYVYGSGSLEGWMDTVVTVMNPWAGYTIYNHDEYTREIELRPLRSVRAQMARVLDQTKWSLEVDVQSGNYIDGKNTFGVSAGAMDGKDNLDSPEPPVFDKYLSLYSVLINAKGKKQKITSDFRGVSDSLQVWDLVLDSKVDQDIATMNLSMMGDIGTSVVWFIDMQNGQAHDLSQTSNSTFSIDLGPNQLSNKYKLVYGDEDEAGALVRDIVALIPKEFSLGNNYPNPFNPSTTIPFTISKPGLVVINIYDLNGRLVRMVVNKHLETGHYSRIWDGKNSQGIPVSSGVYYYGLQTKTFNSYKKMILIK